MDLGSSMRGAETLRIWWRPEVEEFGVECKVLWRDWVPVVEGFGVEFTNGGAIIDKESARDTTRLEMGEEVTEAAEMSRSLSQDWLRPGADRLLVRTVCMVVESSSSSSFEEALVICMFDNWSTGVGACLTRPASALYSNDRGGSLGTTLVPICFWRAISRRRGECILRWGSRGDCEIGSHILFL